jgi:hypothetical protein
MRQAWKPCSTSATLRDCRSTFAFIRSGAGRLAPTRARCSRSFARHFAAPWARLRLRLIGKCWPRPRSQSGGALSVARSGSLSVQGSEPWRRSHYRPSTRARPRASRILRVPSQPLGLNRAQSLPNLNRLARPRTSRVRGHLVSISNKRDPMTGATWRR